MFPPTWLVKPSTISTVHRLLQPSHLGEAAGDGEAGLGGGDGTGEGDLGPGEGDAGLGDSAGDLGGGEGLAAGLHPEQAGGVWVALCTKSSSVHPAGFKLQESNPYRNPGRYASRKLPREEIHYGPSCGYN